VNAPDIQPTTSLAEWQHLGDLAAALIKRPLTDIVSGPRRFVELSFRCEGLLVDFSKQRLTTDVVTALCALAHRLRLGDALVRLMDGDIVNSTERRAALHTALRAPYSLRPPSVRDLIEEQLARLLDFVVRVHDGRWRGHTGRVIRDIVHIGIGGSHLGPELGVEALVARRQRALNFHFLANIDGHAIATVLRSLDPETTLFIVASKSFSTTETKVNAASARAWFLERTGRIDAIASHFVAVTSNTKAAAEFGIAADNVFAMWDWVGGRYSLWSAVGLPLALAVGRTGFEEFLAGAHVLDQHARTAPIERNLPALLALVGIWNYNMLGAQTHAVLTYDQRLRLLPSYLQQLEMESNGKSTRIDGSAVDLLTMPVLWGGEETNGQHAFHQQLHQGNRAFSVDFLACAGSAHPYPEHHQWLLANYLAQSEALLVGRKVEVAGDEVLSAHRSLSGNRPSTTILLDELTPRSLGTLLALYEHKTFCQGIIWQINSFDQWGVELGKVLAESIHPELEGRNRQQHDPSTNGLIEMLQHQIYLGKSR
jgi:glucose-6-phosphate isomerase